eukprot:c28814_g1_i1 orf=321-2858(-)
MDTPLAYQLQQAWLQTQINKDRSTSFGSNFQSRGHEEMEVGINGGSQSCVSWDCGQERSFDVSFSYSSPEELRSMGNSSVYLEDLSAGDESLVTPVLRYINDMLMDEQMEDRICMLQECSAYQAMAKGFYDILGEDSSSLSLAAECSSGDSGEIDDTEEWINGLLNLDRKTPMEEVSLTWSTEATSIASPDMGTVDSSSQRSLGSSANSYRTDGNDPCFVNSSESSESSFRTDKLRHAPCNDIVLEENAVASGGLPQLVPYFNAEKTLEDNIFQNDVFRHTDRNPDRSLYVRDVSPSLPSGNSAIFDGIDLDFNPNLSVANHLRSMLQKGEVDHDKAKRFPTAVKSALASNGNFPGRHNDRRDPSGRDPDKELLAQGLQSASLAMPSTMARSMRSTTKETLSSMQNKALNSEVSAESHQDGGSLPSCNGMQPLTLWKQESVPAASKQGGGNESEAKHSNKPYPVDLVGSLVSCAEAIARNNLTTAHMLLHDIRQHASPYGTATERLAHYFAEALVARLSGTGPRLYTAIANNRPSAAKMLKSLHTFVEVCPFGTLSHFFANQSILKAAEGASRLHIVDYGILYGFQWPFLMRALAERKGGPPLLRITGIEFPQPGCNPEERVQETGQRLTEHAKAYGVPFEYHAIAGKWETVQPTSLNIRQDELLIVNCINRLRHLMDETVIAASPRMVVLSKIRSMNPKLLVLGVVNAGLNAPFFTSRFKEALFYYSSKLDILESTIGVADNPERLMVEQEMIGRDILNVVACEGLERVERPETYRQCQSRTERAGFALLPVNPTLLSKGRAVLSSYHKDFVIDDNGKWFFLGWKGRIMHAFSTWRPSSQQNVI